MNLEKKVFLIALVFCMVAMFASIFAYSPYIDANNINGRLDIAGVRLLMGKDAVEKLLGKGSPVGGFGAEFFEYAEAKVSVTYPLEGLLRGKAGSVSISDPKYSICGIHGGATIDEAKPILEKQGFRQAMPDRHLFRKGSVTVYISGKTVGISIEDWTLKGRVY
ncbi:MAG TPA: hypothetical protein VN549_02280 [Negativicutes bacterium]|nr:hypothetical protein [Negativicutes bacterium]